MPPNRLRPAGIDRDAEQDEAGKRRGGHDPAGGEGAFSEARRQRDGERHGEGGEA